MFKVYGRLCILNKLHIEFVISFFFGQRHLAGILTELVLQQGEYRVQMRLQLEGFP